MGKPFDLTGLGATGMVAGRVSNMRREHENIQTEQCRQKKRDATNDFRA